MTFVVGASSSHGPANRYVVGTSLVPHLGHVASRSLILLSQRNATRHAGHLPWVLLIAPLTGRVPVDDGKNNACRVSLPGEV